MLFVLVIGHWSTDHTVRFETDHRTYSLMDPPPTFGNSLRVIAYITLATKWLCRRKRKAVSGFVLSPRWGHRSMQNTDMHVAAATGVCRANGSIFICIFFAPVVRWSIHRSIVGGGGASIRTKYRGASNRFLSVNRRRFPLMFGAYCRVDGLIG